MLTKNLLQITRRSGAIHCKFLPETTPVLALCGNLLELYQEACRNGRHRSEIEERLDAVVKNCFAPKTAAGLSKLILDHAEFSSAKRDSEDLETVRESVFKLAAKVLADPPADPERFRAEVARQIALPDDLYGDLPEQDVLEKVPEWSAKELRNRYNVALIQGCLLYARNLVLAVEAATPMELRKFMRRMNFFRLLANVKKSSGNTVLLDINGPGAVLSESRQYGLQLASFFPAVLLLKNWKMKAEIVWTERTVPERLTLDSQHCDCRSTFNRWSAFVPEEVAMFLENFRKSVPEWQEAPEAKLPKIPQIGTIFPDLSFAWQGDPEKVVHVELFHRWHEKNMEERLMWLDGNPGVNFAIGIDRALLEKTPEETLLARHPSLARHGFFFRNYPGVERVKKVLNQLIAEEKIRELPGLSGPEDS